MDYSLNTIRISFELCNYCNLNCQYCSANMPYIDHKIKKEISLEIIKVIVYYVNKVFPQFKIVYSIKGGEPTLSPYISQIIEILYHKTNNLEKIILVSNNTVLLQNTHIDFNKITGLFTYHFSQIYNTKKSDIFLENITFLKHNGHPFNIILLIDKTTNKTLIKPIYDKIHSITSNVEIKSAFPINNYTDENFDYTKVSNAYNLQYNMSVYYLRTFKIDYNLLYCYVCDLSSKIPLKNRKIIYPEVWGYIASNINKTVVCTKKDCTCPNLCFVTE